jgi:hypothetical protein
MAHCDEASVIFDRGGGITVDLIGDDGYWSHYYQGEPEDAAEDVYLAFKRGFSRYEGNATDAAGISPTRAEISDACYRVEVFNSLAELAAMPVDLDDDWRHRLQFAKAIAELVCSV